MMSYMKIRHEVVTPSHTVGMQDVPCFEEYTKEYSNKRWRFKCSVTCHIKVVKSGVTHENTSQGGNSPILGYGMYYVFRVLFWLRSKSLGYFVACNKFLGLMFGLEKIFWSDCY